MFRKRPFVIVLACVTIHLCPVASRSQEKTPDEIQKLLNQGIAFIQAGNPKAALEPFTAALARAEKELGTDHPRTAFAHFAVARTHADLGDYPKALASYQRALAIQEAKLGKDHPQVAHTLNNLATVYESTGQYPRAEAYFKRSLAIREAKLGKDHPDVAVSWNNLANLYTSLGQYAKAEPLLLRSLRLRETKLGRDHPDVATSLNNLGELYRLLGQYAKAEPLHLRGLKIREAKLGKNHPQVAVSLNNLSVLYQCMGQFARAEPLIDRSLKIREELVGKDHPDVAVTLNNLAALHQNLGEYEKSVPVLERSVTILEQVQGKDHPLVATSVHNLALAHEITGQYAKAEPLYLRGLKVRQELLGKSHPDVADSLVNLAVLYQRTGRFDEAARLFDRARQGSRRHVGLVLPFLPPVEQAAFLAVNERQNFQAALSMALQRKDTPGMAERSAAWLLNGKAVAEESLARSVLLARDSRDPSTGKLAERLRELRASLARLSHAAPATGQEKSREEQLADLTRQEQQVARQLAAAGGAAGATTSWHDLAELHERLPAEAAFLDIARFNVFDHQVPYDKRWQPARCAARITVRKGETKLVDLGDAAAIDAAVVEVRRALEEAAKRIRSKGEPEAEKALRGPLEKLSGLVLKPLLPHVGKAKQWIVLPDGNTWLVPWETLLLPDGKYATERHAVSYVVSGRDLVQPPAFKGKPSRALVVADPDFDLDAKTAREETQRLAKERLDTEETRGLSSLLRLVRIPRLHGTRSEAKAIEKPLVAYTKQAPRQLVDKYALEGLVKQARNPRVLVLATHGFFLPTDRVKPGGRAGDKAPPPGWENPLLRCGLLLAGCNDAAKATDGDDGVLTGLEVAGMDLRGCEMVVLSACETGLGDVQNGEGVAGLRQAFRLAGAESVVSTLWQVPDRASAQLMALFFQGLAKGKDRPTALREAQRKVIEERREDTGAAHPFFWAAFTLTGR